MWFSLFEILQHKEVSPRQKSVGLEALTHLMRVSPSCGSMSASMISFDDEATDNSSLLTLQVLEGIVRSVAVHIALGGDREADAVVQFAEVADRRVVSGLLVPKLVAREA